VLLLGRAETSVGKGEPLADRAHERAMAGDAREHHAIDCAEREVSSNGGRECVDEPGRADGVEGIEAVLPPQPENAEAPCPAVDPGLDTAHEPVAEQDRQDVVAPSSFRGRNVDLPDVVEAEQPTEQVAIPDERVERREERDAGVRMDVSAVVLHVGHRRLEHVDFRPDDEARPTDTLDLDRDELPGVHELRVQLASADRADPEPVFSTDRLAGCRAVPKLLAAGDAEQPVGSVSREELVAELLARPHPALQQLGRKEALDEVVQPPVPVAAGDPEDPSLGERLEERTHLVRGPPVPVDRRAWLHVR
jgi:hypothetical protein